MHIASKTSTLFLLATLVVAPLAACEKINVLDTAKETISQSIPNDEPIRNSITIGADTDSDELRVASTVEGFYSSIGTPEIRAAIANRYQGSYQAEYASFAYVYPTESGNATNHRVNYYLSAIMSPMKTDADYSIIIKSSNITIKDDTATVDTFGSTDIIDGNLTTITADRAKIINMIKVDGEWFIDVIKTREQQVESDSQQQTIRQ